MAPIKKARGMPKRTTKRTVSIEGLFRPAKHKRSQKPAPSTKTSHAANGLFSRSQEQKHPDYLRLLDATSQYRAGAQASQVDQLDVVHEELLSRLNGFDANGKRVEAEGVPSQQQMDELNARTATLFASLAEDTMRMRTSNGEIEVIKLGRTMTTYQKRVQEKAALVRTLLQQLEQVDVEIGEATRAVTEDVDGALLTATAKFETRMAQITKQLEAARDTTLEEIAIAQRTEAENTKKFNSRLRGLMEDVAYS